MQSKDENYLDHFAAALRDNLSAMAGQEAALSEPFSQLDTFSSQGLAIIIGITGVRRGRIILDISRKNAAKLSALINEENIVPTEMIIDTMAEFTNIVSGNAITTVNNQHKGLGLMLTPPSVFYGDKLQLVSPKIKASVIHAKAPVGDLVISVGFERG